MTLPPFDAHLDLQLGRDIDLPPALLWRVWTTPALLQQWWAPAPLTTPECEMELQPGGVFRTVMQAPDGARYPTSGCFLDIVPQRRLVFSDALQPGFRPASKPFFTAVISFDALADGGTRYNARVLHKDAIDRQTHADMGFHDGWGRCMEQMIALARTL